MKQLTKKQVDWCNEHLKRTVNLYTKKKTTWKFKDGKVNVYGNVNISEMTFKKFPIEFGNIWGDFDCSNCTSLISLQGAPTKVNGNFNCDSCTSLTSLEGAPSKVSRSFYCNDCTSLTSLKGAPQEIEIFSCDGCTSLISLKGSPQKVKWNFSCYGCKALSKSEKSIIDDYDDNEIDWETAHKLIHKPSLGYAYNLGLL